MGREAAIQHGTHLIARAFQNPQNYQRLFEFYQAYNNKDLPA